MLRLYLLIHGITRVCAPDWMPCVCDVHLSYQVLLIMCGMPCVCMRRSVILYHMLLLKCGVPLYVVGESDYVPCVSSGAATNVWCSLQRATTAASSPTPPRPPPPTPARPRQGLTQIRFLFRFLLNCQPLLRLVPCSSSTASHGLVPISVSTDSFTCPAQLPPAVLSLKPLPLSLKEVCVQLPPLRFPTSTACLLAPETNQVIPQRSLKGATTRSLFQLSCHSGAVPETTHVSRHPSTN